MQSSDLAWALAESISRFLTNDQRFRVYIALGAGEFQTVICELAQTAASVKVPLSIDVASALNAWNEAYSEGTAAVVGTLHGNEAVAFVDDL